MHVMLYQIREMVVSLKLIRFKIADAQVRDIENIFSSEGSNTWYGHYGSRIIFDNNKYLYLSVGEGGITSYGGRIPAIIMRWIQIELGESTQNAG